jgi:hypothetical protein
MPSPAPNLDPRRATRFGGIVVALLVVPTVLGLVVTAAGESRPPIADEEAFGPGGTRVLSEEEQEALGSEAPPSNAQTSAEDALTRPGGDDPGFPRLQFLSDATGEIRVDNGGTVALADGYGVTVSVDPFPPTSFDVDVTIGLTRDGEPVVGAAVDTVWDMTLMTHGPFTTALTESGDGAYGTSYDFFMFGPWYVDTTVTAPGTEPVTFRLSIYVWPE